jgi:hypothetical protein
VVPPHRPLAGQRGVRATQRVVVFQLLLDRAQEFERLAGRVADQHDVRLQAVQGAPERVGEADPGGFARTARRQHVQPGAALGVQRAEAVGEPEVERGRGQGEGRGQVFLGPGGKRRRQRRLGRGLLPARKRSKSAASTIATRAGRRAGYSDSPHQPFPLTVRAESHFMSLRHRLCPFQHQRRSFGTDLKPAWNGPDEVFGNSTSSLPRVEFEGLPGFSNYICVY